MKFFTFALLATVLPLAAFDLPKEFFTMEKLDDARVKAAAKPQMVGFLITDPMMQPT